MRFIRLFLLALVALAVPAQLRAQISITEFLANNVEGILDEDGNHEDWIEVKNTGLTAVDLSGWFLTDSVTQLRKWAFPSKTLQPGQYLLVFASNKDRRNPLKNLHTNFKLDGGGEYLALTKAEVSGATTVVQFWNPYPPQAADVSYGITEAGTTTPLVSPTTAVKYRKPDATSGPAMAALWRGGNEPFTETSWTAGVAALGHGAVPNPAIVASANIQHRYNSTETSLTYDTSPHGRVASLTTASFLASAIDTSASPLKRTGLLNFIGTENDQFLINVNTVALQTAYNVPSSTVAFWIKANPPTGTGSSGAMLWDRRTGTGVGAGIVIVQGDDGKILLQSEGAYCSLVGSVNVSDNQWHHIAVTMNQAAGSNVTIYVDGQTTPLDTTVNTGTWNWTTAQPIEIGRSHDPYWKRYTGLMDDIRFYNRNLTAQEIADIAGGADTTNGTTLFGTTGVSSADYTTNLSTITSAGSNPSVYVRIPFTIPDLNAISGVILNVQQADGFIAWVNGVQVLATNAPASPAWNSAAASSLPQDPGRFRVTSIPKTGGPLVQGNNILAIQLMNNAVGAPNVLLRPTIDAISATSGNSVYFTTETPGAANSTPFSAVGPHVANTTKNPTPPVGGAGSAPLIITSEVKSTLNLVSTVQVAYRTMWGAETLVPMLDNGVSPDGIAGDKIYTAAIPTTGITAGQMIRWRIVAKDSANNTTTDPLFIDLDGIAGQDTDQYYGTIAPDAGYTTGLPVLHWFLENPANADNATGTRSSVFYLGRFYDFVYVNIHGQSTQGFPKKSYNLNFNKDNRFKWKEGEQEIRSVNFLSNYADKSKLRNTLAWAAWGDSKHAAFHFSEQLHVRRATSAESMQFFSIADMVEDGNEEYLDRNGLDKDGALYKMYNSLEGSTAPGAEKKTREFEDNTDLAEFVAGISSGRAVSLRRQFLYDNVNIPALINFCVMHSLINNTDWGHKNYYIYRDTMGSKEWYALPWDQDLSFGHTWIGSQGYFDDEIHSQGGLPNGGGGNNLMQLVYSVPELNDMFVRRYETLRDQFLISATATNGIWDNRVTSLIDRIDPPVGGPPPVETTWIADFNVACKWLVPSAGNGGIDLTAAAGAQQWTNYTSPPNIANWTDGTTGVGYDVGEGNYNALIGSNTGTLMSGINGTCYVRVEFNIPDAAALANIGTLILGMKYDDGFRAYINGAAVAGDQDQDASMTTSPGTAIASGTARDENAAVQFSNFNITATALPVLRVGTNVLAVHCLNTPATSSDLIMVPRLTSTPPNTGSTLTDADLELQKWGTWTDGGGGLSGAGLDAATHPHGPRIQAMRILNSNPNPPQTTNPANAELGDTTFAYLPGRRSFLFTQNPTSNGLGFPPAQPLSPVLSIEEIDFNPASANQDDEYFVIRNTSGSSVDLSGWHITGAVDYTFPAGTVVPAYTTGTENIGRLHVAKSPAAFRVRTVGATGGQYRYVVGPFDGSLSARGEIIELRRPDLSLLMSQNWTAAPTAAQNQLRVSELNYSPSAPTPAETTAIPGVAASDFEYIELVNTGGTTLSLAGARFTRGIDFTFPLGASLAPGARLVLVSNSGAFTHRYGAGATIGGQYIGNLNNGGDTLRIVDSQGEEVLEFKYEPSWFPQSDGGGYSLVTRSAAPGWTDYGTPSSPVPSVWALSATTGGTPGLGDTDNANGFEGWRFNHWTLGEVQTIGAPVATTADADGDGMTNFAEYAYGKNPRTSDNASLSSAGKVNVSGTDYPTVTFTRRHLAADIAWSVQESTDLTAWAATTILVSTTQLGNGLEQVTYRSATAAGSTPRYFRVVATK